MVQFIPSPDARELLPPLLACLPAAFASPRPPPALFPLLSPILRQRLHLNTDSASASSPSWVTYLCWESNLASKLVDLVSDSNVFELHPVSGEMDYGMLEAIKYQRLDEETLQAKVVIVDLGIAVIYVWCPEDGPSDASGWRVSEVVPVQEQGADKRGEWHSTIGQADEQAKKNAFKISVQSSEVSSLPQEAANGSRSVKEDDDDYWAMYDATPAPPSAKTRQAPFTPATAGSRGLPASEAEYFERYASNPSDMDSGSPDRSEEGRPLVRGNDRSLAPRPPLQSFRSIQKSTRSVLQDVPEDTDVRDYADKFPAPTPVPDSATRRRFDDPSEALMIAEMAVKQHVSTNMKSMFRLCRNVGMEIEEFNDLIKVELETMSLVARDE